MNGCRPGRCIQAATKLDIKKRAKYSSIWIENTLNFVLLVATDTQLSCDLSSNADLRTNCKLALNHWLTSIVRRVVETLKPPYFANVIADSK